MPFHVLVFFVSDDGIGIFPNSEYASCWHAEYFVGGVEFDGYCALVVDDDSIVSFEVNEVGVISYVFGDFDDSSCEDGYGGVIWQVYT